jgi:hypothetical protein
MQDMPWTRIFILYSCIKEYPRYAMDTNIQIIFTYKTYPRYAMDTNIQIIFMYKRLSKIFHSHEYLDCTVLMYKRLSKICHGREYSYYIHV